MKKKRIKPVTCVRPNRYGEKTTTISFSKRIPESKKQEYKDYGNEIIVPLLDEKIKEWEVKKYENTLYTFDMAMDEWEDSFNCSGCGYEGKEHFIYDRTVANGEVWKCKICKHENMVNDEPREDNF